MIPIIQYAELRLESLLAASKLLPKFFDGENTLSKLTKRTVDALPLKTSDYFEWDSELRGFGVRVSPKGAKTLVVQYRAGGRTRRVKMT